MLHYIIPIFSGRTILLPVGWLLLCVLPCAGETIGDKGFIELQSKARKSFEETVTPFINDYCFKCHSNKRQRGGINFQPSLKTPGSSASGKRWKQAIANIKAHDMPPEDSPKQPTDDDRKKFIEAIGLIKYLSPKDPGPFVIRRLTKREYGNTLRDLFGVEAGIAKDLPDEVFGEGYLNSLSPLLSEQYLGIAKEVLDRVLAPEGSLPTEIQKRLFGNAPADGENELEVVKRVARSLTKQAFRRPPSEEELEVLLQVFKLGRDSQLSYSASLRLMFKAVLVSPQFLFITPTAKREGEDPIVPLDSHQLASRLSYLLWATMPDAELAALADSGQLRKPKVYRGQVKRLLSDKRSRALFDGFGAQWLGVEELDTMVFDFKKFPQMTPGMRLAMYDEARLFFEALMRENGSVVNFVQSDFTFLNGTLSSLYGMEDEVVGPAMRKVLLKDSNRGGVLGMPGILATTSFPNRTSPVKRGVWVLEQVLGEVIPPAPPNVPELEKQKEERVANLTLRERTELHRSDSACATCHKIMDPIGFGLENFDAIGRWRDQDDTGGAIDATGELPGGKRFTTPTELKEILAGRKPEVARNLTEKLLAYALCRPLEGYDHIVVDRLMESIAADDYGMKTLIIEVVSSYPFLNHHIQKIPRHLNHGK
ncbi:MAG: DUF1592 domain-containing protein [Akkermansiaceae bacterium]